MAQISAEDPAAALRAGDLERARTLAIEAVKSNPGSVALRAFLFQLSAVEGDWNRATQQLDTIAKLDPSVLDFVSDYRAAIVAEGNRERVLVGHERPTVFGTPPHWIAELTEALRLDATGEDAAASDLRDRALEGADPVAGSVDDRIFGRITDADPRFGPVLECVMNGGYSWVPFSSLSSLKLEPPRDLRDMVWTVGVATFVNGGEWPVMIPTRYHGSESRAGGTAEHALARRTEWLPLGERHSKGQGQRLFDVDDDEVALLDIRTLHINVAAHIGHEA